MLQTHLHRTMEVIFHDSDMKGGTQLFILMLGIAIIVCTIFHIRNLKSMHIR